eukprot:scaffold2974_cov181-Amphora_coffeaeformis.AAC.3
MIRSVVKVIPVSLTIFPLVVPGQFQDPVKVPPPQEALQGAVFPRIRQGGNAHLSRFFGS